MGRHNLHYSGASRPDYNWPTNRPRPNHSQGPASLYADFRTGRLQSTRGNGQEIRDGRSKPAAQQYLKFFRLLLGQEHVRGKFVVVFHTRLDKISKLDMNEELKGHLLLKHANLDTHDCNLVIGAAGGDYSLQSLATSLRNSFRSEGLPTSSMNTNPSRSRCYQPSSPNNYNSSKVRLTSRHTSKPPIPGDPLFFTYMNSEADANSPSAIVDSGSCCSVVGKETLDRAMRKLKINQLQDEPICQANHLFGSSSTQSKLFVPCEFPFGARFRKTTNPSSLTSASMSFLAVYLFSSDYRPC